MGDVILCERLRVDQPGGVPLTERFDAGLVLVSVRGELDLAIANDAMVVALGLTAESSDQVVWVRAERVGTQRQRNLIHLTVTVGVLRLERLQRGAILIDRRRPRRPQGVANRRIRPSRGHKRRETRATPYS